MVEYTVGNAHPKSTAISNILSIINNRCKSYSGIKSSKPKALNLKIWLNTLWWNSQIISLHLWHIQGLLIKACILITLGILTHLSEDTYPIPCLNITEQTVTLLTGISFFVSRIISQLVPTKWTKSWLLWTAALTTLNTKICKTT